MRWSRPVAAILPLLLAGCRSTPAPEAPFRDIAREAGIVFGHVSGGSGHFYLPEIMGSGAGLLDYDGDGDLDVYLVQGAGTSGNRLFRNELVPSGAIRFTDVTGTARVGFQGYGMGVAVGDYDNDGDPDLYVTSFGPNVLYRNDGDGRFTDVTSDAGVADDRWSTSAAFVDYDRDGRLDLFVADYLNYTLEANKPCTAPTGEPDYCNPAIYQGLPSHLFHNDGDGKFRDVTVASGIGAKVGKALGVVCFDYDRDGWPDIYVANDGVANHLWHNRQGRFDEIALPAGVAYDQDGRAQAGMGVDAADFDNDGADDLFVTNLANETNNLYRHDGHGNFTDVIVASGMGEVSRPYTGFGTGFFDYDHDGHLDLLVANGAVTRMESQRGQPWPFRQPNQLFRNEGGRFREIVRFPDEAVSRGAAFGDLDNDGDIDIVVTANNGPAKVLLNQVGARVRSLQVRLEGVRSNRQAIGARVAITRGGRPVIWRRVHTDGSYLSASDSRAHFGRPPSDYDGVFVEWPDGASELWQPPPQSGFAVLRQGTGRAVTGR